MAAGESHAATALQALEELRMEEDEELQALKRAAEIVAVKDCLLKLRDITYSTRIDWDSILRAQQTEGGGSDDRNVTDEQFVEALHVANENTSNKLTPGEFETLLRKFCDYKGDIRISHFVRALNLGAPADHADPDLFFDQLPQPYRSIVEIMEEFIIDAAWEFIDKKYKLSAQSSIGTGDEDDGKGEEAKKIAMAMATSCYPINFTTISQTPTCTAVSPDGAICIVGSENGSMQLVDCVGYNVLENVSAFPESHGGTKCISKLVRSENFSVYGDQPYVFAAAASTTTKAEVAAKLAAANAPQEEDPKAKKGKGKKGAAPDEPEDGGAGGGIAHVYEVWPNGNRFVQVSTIEASQEIASITVAEDSRYVAVSLADGSVQVYPLPKRPLPPQPSTTETSGVGGMEPVAEEAETGVKEDDGEDSGSSRYSREKTVLERTMLTVALLPEDRKGVLRPTHASVQAAGDVNASGDNEEAGPLSDTGTSVGANEGSDNSPTAIVHFIQTPSSTEGDCHTTGFFVWWPGCNHLRRYFLVDSEEEKEETKEGEEGTNELTRLLHSEWMLTNAITASAVDVSCSILALGIADGSVMVWDISTGTSRAVFRRHTGLKGNRASVSSLCLYGQRYVVSGAMDGSLQINDLLDGSVNLRCKKLMVPSRRPVSRANTLKPLGPSSKMISMREKDGSQSVLNLFCMKDIPIAIAVCEDSYGVVVLRLYDLPSGTFMGCLDLRESKEMDAESCRWMFGQCGEDNNTEMDARPQGDASRSGRLMSNRTAGRGVTALGGKKSLGATKILAEVSGSSVFVLCADQAQSKEKINYVPPTPKPEAEGEDPSEEIVSEVPAEPSVDFQFTGYADWKIICDSYPAIALCCEGNIDAVQNAKRLFTITTAEQRSDPAADLNAFLFGPAGLHPKPYGNAVPQAPSTSEHMAAPSVGSRKSHSTNRSTLLSRNNSRVMPSGAPMSSSAGESRLLSRVSGSKAQSGYSGTVGRRDSRGASKSQKKENVLESLALGHIQMDGNAESLNLTKPSASVRASFLNSFSEMRTSSRMKRELRVKKRREELLKLCTPEL
eukprot:g4783.t1